MYNVSNSTKAQTSAKLFELYVDALMYIKYGKHIIPKSEAMAYRKMIWNKETWNDYAFVLQELVAIRHERSVYTGKENPSDKFEKLATLMGLKFRNGKIVK